MDFLKEEVITNLGLSPEQVAGITTPYNEHIATLKLEWDGKANTDAQGIIEGAVSKVTEVTKIPRNAGEKAADYISRAGVEHLGSLKTDMETAKSNYETKLAEFKGDETTKAEMEKYKGLYEGALEKYKDFDDIKTKADKLEATEQTLSKLNLQVAFGSVKPSFPDTANKFEVKAKWDEFQAKILEKWVIEIGDDNVAYAVDKENHHNKKKLEDLVPLDENVSALLAGRQQKGIGSKTVKDVTIDGIPFAVPENASLEERSKLIQTHLEKEGIGKASPQYAAKFRELNTKINDGLTKK